MIKASEGPKRLGGARAGPVEAKGRVIHAGPSRTEAGAILSIDLAAVRDNFRTLSRLAGPARCAAVVKADGYGLGASQIASALSKEGCDVFFIAHVSEALRLRRSLGGQAEIFVLNGIPPGAEHAAASAGLAAVLDSTEQLTAWGNAARQAGRTLPAAIQVDTGMSRLGMAPAEVDGLAADSSALRGIDLRLVMSHLACAEEPQNPANSLQRRNFEALRRKLPDAPASLANSSGIFLDKDFHYQLVRPGSALYGINPVPGKPNPMRPVMRLAAKIIQTRTVPGDTGIGYGHAFRAKGSLRLATIAIGYADGWPRRAGASAWFDGIRLPFVGRVSMDSVIVDISALPDGALHGGDLVELIGADQSVDEVAEIAGTISYEILTGLGRRFHRIYTGG